LAIVLTAYVYGWHRGDAGKPADLTSAAHAGSTEHLRNSGEDAEQKREIDERG
jgi:hypothetical protein